MRLVEVLKERSAGPVPVWLMRQAGRYLPEYRKLREEAGSFLDLCYAPERAAKVTLQPIERFGFDAAILFSDILVVPHALGQEVTFVAGEGPRLKPVSDAADIERLEPERVVERLAPVFETVERVRGSLDANRALIGFCGAPWTVASYMVAGRGTPDQGPARLWAYRDREGFSRLIDCLTRASIDYLDRQIAAGADVVQIFDTWAGALPDAEFRRWCVKPLEQLVAGVRERHPDVPVIVFPRGAGAGYEEIVSRLAPDGVSIDTAYRLDDAAALLQPRTTVQGNLDPLVLVAGGRALDEAVDTIFAALKGGPFIFNLGHGIVPETPIAHVEALMARIRAHNEGAA